MKKSGIKVLMMLISVIMISMISDPVIAQRPEDGKGLGPGPGPGRGDCLAAIPGLTEEQLTAIEQLRVKHFRKVELIRAEIGEKEARLVTLRLAEKEDVKAIDNTIDDISKLRGDLMKLREAHQREIKALLNDSQKAYFDAGKGKGRKGDGCGRRGRHEGGGRGMGYGPGNRGECPYNK